jgi:hypothetical protein
MEIFQCNQLTASWLADSLTAMAAYQSLSVGHCCWYYENSAVVMAGDRVLGAECMPSLHSYHCGYLFLSTLNKHWEIWRKSLTGIIKSVISPTQLLTISSTVGTFQYAFVLYLMWASSESFIQITHP